MRVLVADDEPLARERLTRLLADLPGVEVVAEAGNGREALEQAAAQAADVLLLDIRMPGMDGLEAARHLAQGPDPPAVVFTTAYDQHALEAFEARAVDYLLKPVSRERLARALERARRLSAAEVGALAGVGAPARSHLSVSSHRGLSLVPVAEVRYLRAERKYVSVGYPGGELLSEEPLKDFEQEFGERFLRVHRNALVAVAHVTGLERDPEGRHRVVLDGVEARLEVSRRLLPGVRRRLRQGSGG